MKLKTKLWLVSQGLLILTALIIQLTFYKAIKVGPILGMAKISPQGMQNRFPIMQIEHTVLWRVQELSRRVQERSKRAPRAPQECSKSVKSAAKALQYACKSAQDGPGVAQVAPKLAPRAPRLPPSWPQERPS